MNQSFNSFLKLNKGPVIGDIGDFSKNSCLFRVPPCDIGPRVLAKLFHPQRDPATFTIKLEHPDLEFIAHAQHL